jgi:hypothetical protein
MYYATQASLFGSVCFEVGVVTVANKCSMQQMALAGPMQ